MKQKYIAATILPVTALFLAGAGVVSAHGGFGRDVTATPEAIAVHQEEMFAQKAHLFGMTIDEIKNLWADGASFQDIADASGLSKEDIQNRMRAAHTERMQQRLDDGLVERGVITAEQAERRLKGMENRATKRDGKRRFHAGKHFGDIPFNH
jgi:hypothetical protein